MRWRSKNQQTESGVQKYSNVKIDQFGKGGGIKCYRVKRTEYGIREGEIKNGQIMWS